MNAPELPPISLRGELLHFRTFTGFVRASQKRSETHVYGSTTNGSGSTHSTIHRIHEFWIACANGLEIPVRVDHHCALVADGQTATVVCAFRGTDWQSGTPVRLYNHSSQTHDRLNDGTSFCEGSGAGVLALLVTLAGLGWMEWTFIKEGNVRGWEFLGMLAMHLFFAFGVLIILANIFHRVAAPWRRLRCRSLNRHLDAHLAAVAGATRH